MALFDFQHPFFAPTWRKVAVVAVCFGWGAFEMATGAAFFAILFWGLGGAAAWSFWLRKDDGT